MDAALALSLTTSTKSSRRRSRRGRRRINIPDTVGYAVPEEFGEMIAQIIAEVPNSGDAVISVHCHDDLGMAVTQYPLCD